MILLAESGSTKTQWNLITDQNSKALVNTPGINPFNLTQSEIESIVRPVSVDIQTKLIQKIYFFGAGCSSEKNKSKMQSALNSIFKCSTIVIDTDLKAACLSLSGDNPGIIALLGTGSNSCLWNGNAIEENIPALGYVLGDEGGGVSIGKTLIADYFKKQMPEHLRTKFTEKYAITIQSVLERVYQMQMPNQYLASYALFAKEFINETYCYDLVHNQFESFIKRNLVLYPNFENCNTYFCGSIAYNFKDILEDVCQKHNIRITKIIKEPIADLALYFKQKL